MRTGRNGDYYEAKEKHIRKEAHFQEKSDLFYPQQVLLSDLETSGGSLILLLNMAEESSY